MRLNILFSAADAALPVLQFVMFFDVLMRLSLRIHDFSTFAEQPMHRIVAPPLIGLRGMGVLRLKRCKSVVFVWVVRYIFASVRFVAGSIDRRLNRGTCGARSAADIQIAI